MMASRKQSPVLVLDRQIDSNVIFVHLKGLVQSSCVAECDTFKKQSSRPHSPLRGAFVFSLPSSQIRPNGFGLCLAYVRIRYFASSIRGWPVFRVKQFSYAINQRWIGRFIEQFLSNFFPLRTMKEDKTISD